MERTTSFLPPSWEMRYPHSEAVCKDAWAIEIG
jgi:hypothetical protein